LDEVGARSTEYMNIPVAIDQKMDIYVNNIFYTTLYLTPSQVEEAVIGLLYTDKLVKNLNDIKSIKYGEDKLYVDADVAREVKRVVYDECVSIRDVEDRVEDNGYRLSWKNIVDIFRDFNKSTMSIRRGLAIHTTALYIHGGEKLFINDVSRHVAILKILGMALKRGVDTSRSVLITSGRVSSDMIYRAAILRIPIVISLHGPLSSGLSAALLSGITFIANLKRVPEKGLRVLTNEFRILDIPNKEV